MIRCGGTVRADSLLEQLVSIVLVVSRLLGFILFISRIRKRKSLGCGLVSSDSLRSSAPCMTEQGKDACFPELPGLQGCLVPILFLTATCQPPPGMKLPLASMTLCVFLCSFLCLYLVLLYRFSQNAHPNYR